MKRRKLAGFLSLMMACSLIPQNVLAEEMAPAEEQEADYGIPGEDYVEGEVIVRVRGGEDALYANGSNASTFSRRSVPSFSTEVLMELNSDGEETGEKNDYAVFSVAESADDEEEETSEIVLVKGDDTEALIQELVENPNVEYALPNYKVELYGDDIEDPMYDYQWGLDNKIDLTGTWADMDAEEAWASGAGSETDDKVVVAVIDSGVDYTHPDLAGVMWNDGESIPALQALGGGKYGANYALGEDTTDPRDTDVGHGTHCSSVIASQWNQEGVRGVSGNAEIMAIRFAGANSSSMASAVKAFRYMITAKQNGVNVKVASNSWGVDRNFSQADALIGDLTMEAAREGIMVCFASGNSNLDLDMWPNIQYQNRNILVVGAMESSGTPAYFSNYGQSSVDVFAPGTQILAATSLYGKENPKASVQMAPQYIPWIQDADDTLIYNQFNGDSIDDETPITYSVYKIVSDEDGNNYREYLEESDISMVTGFKPEKDGDKAVGISLDGVQAGDKFGVEIQIHLTKEEKELLAGQENLYIAMEGGLSGAELVSNTLTLKQNVPEGSGEKEQLSARLRFADNNWVCLTGKIPEDQRGFLKVSEEEPVPEEEAVSEEEETPGILRLEGEMTGNAGDAMLYLDNIGFGTKTSNYYYSDGTSMACPAVAGVAALVSEKYSDPEEVKARIMGSVVTDQNFYDKCVTSGYVNADQAYNFTDEEMTPVVECLDQEDGIGILKGWYFGENAGKLYVGEQEITAIESWSDREIRFVLPEGVEGKQKIAVLSYANGKTGYQFLTVGQSSKGYEELEAANLDWGEEAGEKVTSQNGTPLAMAAAGNKIMVVGTMGSGSQNYMEMYDIAAAQWNKVELPDQNILLDSYPGTFSIAAAKSKIYFMYDTVGGESAYRHKLATYDVEKEKWTSIVDMTDRTETYFGMITVYRNQLLIVGGDNRRDNKNDPGREHMDDWESLKVRAITPDTGEVIQEYTRLPDNRIGGTIVCNGDKLYIVGGVSDIYEGWYGNDNVSINEVWEFDGESWKTDGGALYDYKDYEQYLVMAAGATKSGIIAAGYVKTSVEDVDASGEEQFHDTWEYDGEQSIWNARNDVRFHDSKTSGIVGSTWDGYFYVLGRDVETGKQIFRRLAVDTADPSENPAEKDDPGKDDPGKDDPGKDDPGKDDPGKNDSGKTTPGTGGNSGKKVTPKTGDSSHSMLWLGILLLSGAGAVGTIGYRRRKSK